VFLEDLDLSWNDLIPSHFKPLLEVLSHNRQLKSLNLSWNTLISLADQSNPYSFSVLSAMEEFLMRRRMAIERGIGAVTTKEIQESMDAPSFVVHCLNKFIRFNSALQSLNLSNTGLNGQVLVGLTRSLRHSRSLLCLHLTANTALNDNIEALYRKRLSVAPHDAKLHIDIENENLEDVLMSKQAAMTEEERKIHEHKV